MSHVPATLTTETLDTNASPILDRGIPVSVSAEAGRKHADDACKNIPRGRGRPRGSLNRIPAQGRKPKPITSEPASLGLRWYVIETWPQAERTVIYDLARTGWRAYLPMVAVRRRDSVTPTIIHRDTAPLFTGIVFVELDRASRNWGAIPHQCPGVRSFIRGPGGLLSPCQTRDIERLMAEDGARLDLADEINTPRVAGAVVAVAGIPGVVVWCDGLTTTVSVEMFGRNQVVSLPWGQVS